MFDEKYFLSMNGENLLEYIRDNGYTKSSFSKLTDISLETIQEKTKEASEKLKVSSYIKDNANELATEQFRILDNIIDLYEIYIK